MVGTLVWGDNVDQKKIVFNDTELEKSILELNTIASDASPITVELRVNEESAIQIIVGLKISPLIFYSRLQSPHYSVSLGPFNDDEWVIFYHHDEYSEMPLKYFLETNVVYEAVKKYFQTGLRPDNINWKNLSI